MGFLPKHVKRQRERKRLRIIALAVLHGFVAIKHRKGEPMWDNRRPWTKTTWEVHWPAAWLRGIGHFPGRARPATRYLERSLHGEH